MRKLYLTLYMLMLIITSAVAQNLKYYRVQIFTNDAGLQHLAAAGVGFDYGEYKKGLWFIGDFSENDLSIIKHSGYQYKVLISDMSAYYVSRNNTAETEPVQEPVTCSTYLTPVNFKLGSMGGFYTYQEMLATLDSMKAKFPNLITLKKRVSATATTAEGRPLYYVKISDHPNLDENEPKILYTALHHAREPESLSQLIFYMWYVLENYTKDPFIKSLADSTEMYFIPCVNPDGYIYNQTTNPQGGGLWRKNRRKNGDGNFGVDLNRNYGYKWGYDNVGSSPYTFDETYRGPSAFSEPETRMVGNFCRIHSFFFSLNHHTYANALIYPYGYKMNTFTPDSALYRQYAIRLAQCNSFSTGTVNQTLGYIANGDSDDWLYGEQTLKEKIFALTPETGSYVDGFWPGKNRIIPLAQRNVDMNLTAARFTKESVYTTSSIVSAARNTLTAENETAIIILQTAPNPCNAYTSVTFKTNKSINMNDLHVEIFDIRGVHLQSLKINAAQAKVVINTSGLKNGVYFISDGQNKSGVAKLVVVQ